MRSVMDRWTVAHSSDLYRIEAWGDGYFGIGPEGHLYVYPERDLQRKINLYALVTSLVEQGIEAPILLRFDGIIRDRIRTLYEAFRGAISEFGYQGTYRLAYPIKVNQQRHVVESVLKAGRSFQIGLEVGSKPELMAVLAMQEEPEGLIICNGYKDSEYVELALLAQKLGRRPIIVIEQPYEVETILAEARKVSVMPELGLRMNPITRASGKWEGSAGEGARFGLTSYELFEVVQKLEEHGACDWIKLLHFHVGSQIPSINSIKRVLKEACRMYTELAKLCPQLQFFDVGGGLAVDYDGSKTSFPSSMNYTVVEYARDVVWAILTACNEEGVKHPDIISESGRAVVAHHAVLVTEVTDVSSLPEACGEIEKPPTDHDLLQELYSLYEELNVKNCHEVFHDTLSLRDEVLHRFNQGDLSLRERAYADRLCKQLLSKIEKVASNLKHLPEDLARLGEALRDMYFCNFSVFQSLPDLWAVDQLFPIMPIHNLDSEPTRRAIIADLTCDSDGKIERFIDSKEVKRYIKLHELKPGEPYYLGLFLVGAYQEILGDLHNLFGDTNAVHVDLDERGEPEVVSVIEGDTIREVLSYVQYDIEDLLSRLHSAIEGALSKGALSEEEAKYLQKRYKEGLEGYTYLVV